MPVRATPRPLPPRVAARPDPAQWGDDELMTLDEAAALFWPCGPLTATSLRTAYRAKQIEVTIIARKLLVTPAAIRRMATRACRAPEMENSSASIRGRSASSRAIIRG